MRAVHFTFLLSIAGLLGTFLSSRVAHAATLAPDVQAVSRASESSASPVISGCDRDNEYDGGCGKGPLLGFIQPSDVFYKDFISPISSPVFFEDPRNVTEARLIYLHHTIPRQLGGGHLEGIACQLRASLNDRWSLIATKDGALLPDDQAPLKSGAADVALGLKYLLLSDPDCQRLVSVGLVYQLPVGSTRSLQGNGEGEFDAFITGGREFWDNAHVLSTFGYRFTTNDATRNDMLYWCGHLDKRIGCTAWYGLTEFDWYHYTSNGDGGVPGVGGLDFFNLGSTGVAGKDVIIWAFGARRKLWEMSELGIAYEIPITQDHDIEQSRLTVDFILRY